jgi:hypothetical protein
MSAANGRNSSHLLYHWTVNAPVEKVIWLLSETVVRRADQLRWSSLSSEKDIGLRSPATILVAVTDSQDRFILESLPAGISEPSGSCLCTTHLHPASLLAGPLSINRTGRNPHCFP